MAQVRTRRVLMIGGMMDGKWHTHEGGGHVMRVLRPLEIKFAEVLKAAEPDLSVPLPQYEEYYLEHVALYGEGLWVGLHRKTVEERDMSRMSGPEAHTVMILRAILQRDVATEMGL